MINILIVEDENIIRQGIRTLINWEALDCSIVGDCANGLDALEFLKNYKVDVVITDIIMPKLTGLELCKTIYELYPSIKMLILSSYSDFTYAREALQYGVKDYILKTNFIKELPIAMKKLSTVLKEEIESQKQSIFQDQDLDQIKVMFLESILYDTHIDTKKITQLINLLGEDLNHFYILFSDLEYMTPPTSEENYYHSMLNFYHMVFQDVWHMSFWKDNHSILTLVNFKEENTDESLKQLVMYTSKILSTVNNYMPFQLNITISNCHRSLHEIRLAYEEIISSLSGLQDMENSLSLYHERFLDSPSTPLPNKSSIIKNFLGFIRSKDLQSLEPYLAELFTQYQYATSDLDNTKLELIIIMSHCFHTIVDSELTGEHLEHCEEEINANILHCNSLHALLKTITRALYTLNTLTTSHKTNYNTLVLCVNNYIQEHYASNIKLNDIANQLHVNSSYLSRLYKSQTGYSIITTLTKYRINKAKELLETGQYLVSEVGCLVGIEDPAYFTNVFTKHVGVSPKNYRLK